MKIKATLDGSQPFQTIEILFKKLMPPTKLEIFVKEICQAHTKELQVNCKVISTEFTLAIQNPSAANNNTAYKICLTLPDISHMIEIFQTIHCTSDRLSTSLSFFSFFFLLQMSLPDSN